MAHQGCQTLAFQKVRMALGGTPRVPNAAFSLEEVCSRLQVYGNAVFRPGPKVTVDDMQLVLAQSKATGPW